MSENANTVSSTGVKPVMLVIPALLIGLVFLPSAAVIAAGMVPTIAARMIDASAGRRFTLTVGAMNLVGTLYFLDAIWTAGHRLTDIIPVLSDVFGWFCVMVATGAGWMIFGLMPTVVARIAEAQTSVRQRRIRQRQEKLVREWGEAVRGTNAINAAGDSDTDLQ
jgi:hypothetical protein